MSACKTVLKKVINESALLEGYSKLVLIVDEMVAQRGTLDQLDPFYIKNYMSMKYEDTKKK